MSMRLVSALGLAGALCVGACGGDDEGGGSGGTGGATGGAGGATGGSGGATGGAGGATGGSGGASGGSGGATGGSGGASGGTGGATGGSGGASGGSGGATGGSGGATGGSGGASGGSGGATGGSGGASGGSGGATGGAGGATGGTGGAAGPGTVVATFTSGPTSSIVIGDAQTVFGLNLPNGTDGAVSKISVSSGQSTPVLPSTDSCKLLCVGGSTLYAVCQKFNDVPKVMSVLVSGGTPTPIFTGANGATVITAVACDASAVYFGMTFAGQATLTKIPSGGSPTPLASAAGFISALVTDTTTAYVFRTGIATPSVESVPLAGGSFTPLAVPAFAVLGPMLQDATHLYWADGFGVRRVLKTGGATSDVNVVSPGSFPDGFGSGNWASWVMVDSSIYWASGGVGGPKVRKTPASGGTPTLVADLAAHGTGEPQAMAYDGANVWIALQTGTGSSKLIKLSK